MFEAITAWATVIIAVATLASIYFAFRGMQSQVKSFAGSVSADLALKLIHDFDSDANTGLRSRVANAFLGGLRINEAEDLFDFFEVLGLFARKGLLDIEVAHSLFFHWTNLYWLTGQTQIQERRKGSAILWADFEYLYNKLLEVEKRTTPNSEYINPSPELIRECLEEELQ
jgi:hypothetical protein